MKFCFDCDDTLYDLSYPFKKTCKELLNIDETFDLESMYATYRSCGDEIFDKIQDGSISIDESGIYRIRQMCKIYHIAGEEELYREFQKMYKSFQKEIFMSDILHDFFYTTTSELAILTNGQDEHQRMKLKALNVFKYFKEENVYTSGQLGFAKPDQRSFKTMFSDMKENISDWYYIGDNYINDMEGAKKVGMKTIHFNRHHGLEGTCSDYVVYSENELVSLLKKLENQEEVYIKLNN